MKGCAKFWKKNADIGGEVAFPCNEPVNIFAYAGFSVHKTIVAELSLVVLNLNSQ